MRLCTENFRKISHNGEGIFASVENEFLATRYHSLVIEESSLSKEFDITARSEDGTIMAIQHNSEPVTEYSFIRNPSRLNTANPSS
jgi:anthranilate/para-aminobenzoate synthase component II